MRLDPNNLMQYIVPQDLKSFGLIPEIIGRLPVLTYLQKLDREALRRILVEPKNSIIKQNAKLLEMDGIKLTFASLPGILAAMLFGPIDGFIVGFLGAFLEQMLHFGFTPTTLLWILPPAIRGLLIGQLQGQQHSPWRTSCLTTVPGSTTR